MVEKSILIIAATIFEIEPLNKFYNEQKILESNEFKNISVDFLISGIGMLQTAVNLQEKIENNSYDLILQLGIAGAYNTSLKIGDVVQVCKEQYGDLGAEDQATYLDAEALGWNQYQSMVFENNYILNALPSVTSISVNTCAGTIATIEFRSKQYEADVENMEGIAFFQVMQNRNVPYHQIRSISNYVIPRDKSTWDIPLAIKNLNIFVSSLLQNIN